MKPLLKWVGGKRSLLDELVPRLPVDYEDRTHIEPFAGSAALFFDREPAQAILSDINSDLINFYRQVRDNPKALCNIVSDCLARYRREDPKETYYAIRGAFNAGQGDATELAAQFLFLNKTGFNGLYRTNKSGAFNVPWGKRLEPNLPTPADIFGASHVLGDVRLAVEDFGYYCGGLDNLAVAAKAFIYFDPPYYGTHNEGAYYNEPFTHDDHVLLAEWFCALDKQGARMMLSNADTPEVREMYEGYNIESIEGRTRVSRSADTRGAQAEVVVRNYG